MGQCNSGNFGFTGVYTASAPYGKGGLGYADFLLGEVNNWNATNSPIIAMREASPQFFAQDDYKVTPHLTLNLGLRYQVQGGWYEFTTASAISIPRSPIPSPILGSHVALAQRTARR